MASPFTDVPETASGLADAHPWQGWLARRARVRRRRGWDRTDGSREGLLDLVSNDYLGLGRDERVRQAGIHAMERHGAGAVASRVAGGTLEVHRELEQALCAYTGRSRALVFSSGYSANLGVLQALGGPGSLFITDEHVHASLVDGARLSGAAVQVARHNDLADVHRLLEENRAGRTLPRVVLVLESVYSVLGDAANLAAAARLCRRYGAVLVVDEAHSLAATGGGSAVRAAGLHNDPHVIVTATLSKALGAQGGVALLGGPQASSWREHLVNSARTFIFDTALSPAAAGAALGALGLADAERLECLRRNLALIHEVLAAHPGLAGRVERGAGAVQSVAMTSAAGAVRTARRLRERGIAVGCFRPPSVPDGISRLRLIAHADHDPRVLREALDVIAHTILQEDSQ